MITIREALLRYTGVFLMCGEEAWHHNIFALPGFTRANTARMNYAAPHFHLHIHMFSKQNCFSYANKMLLWIMDI